MSQTNSRRQPARRQDTPQRVASAMMDIYHTIKSVLRESRNALRERKQHKKGTDK